MDVISGWHAANSILKKSFEEKNYVTLFKLNCLVYLIYSEYLYLHGEEFSTNCETGWAVVTVNGCSLGGVKVVDGRAKNHYPKGLRLK